jgi:hypothetical protein
VKAPVTERCRRVGEPHRDGENPMLPRSRLDDLTPEDRRTRATWARGVAIFYGGIFLLLLVGFLVARGFPTDSPRIARVPASMDAPTGSLAAGESRGAIPNAPLP